MLKPEVTVIIPLYGEHSGRSNLTAVSLAWMQQDVPCEVVIAVAGEIPAVVAPDLDPDRRVTVIHADPGIRAAGTLRNLAAAHARGPALYLTDADVIPLGRDYVTRALRLAGRGVLAQPWMFRLLGGIDALESVAPVDPVDVGVPRDIGVPAESVDPGVTACPESCFMTATTDGTLRSCGGERIEWELLGRDVLRAETPMVWPPAGAYDPGIPKKLQRVAPFHWGGLLVRRWLFDAVGGYCREYSGWGCEDDDLLVKIAASAAGRPLVRGWQTDRDLRCLHLEHPRRYVATTNRVTNRAVLAERLAAGPSTMIQRDLEVF